MKLMMCSTPNSSVELYPHQVTALQLSEGRKYAAYYHDMGLGKTFTGTEKMRDINNRVNLIICQKSKVEDWRRHLEGYSDWEVHDLTKMKTSDILPTSQGKVALIINYDLVFRRPPFKDLTNFTLLLDESQYIQNDKTKRSRYISELKPSAVILLSGTPTNGKYENLWSQLKLLGYDKTRKAYWDTYVRYHIDTSQGFPLTRVYGYKNVEQLKKLLSKLGCQFLKTEEVLTLPSQTELIVDVPTSREYSRFVKDKVVRVQDIELVGDTVSTEILYRRQLCGQYNDAKLKILKDLINSTDSRIVIFYNFTKEREVMRSVCGDRPVSVVAGDIKDLSAYENEDNAITFVQYQAGATGLNLQLSHYMIYFTLPLGKGSCSLWEQSKKRIHRIGQDVPCIYYYLICEKSIEVTNFQSLKAGVDLNNKLFLKEVTK